MTRPNKTITEMQTEYMEQYQVELMQHQRKRRHLKRRLIAFTLFVVVVFGALGIYHTNQRSIHAEQSEKYVLLSERMAELEVEEKRLKEEISLLNDDEYILEIARTKYFLSKKGELIFQVEDIEDRSY